MSFKMAICLFRTLGCPWKEKGEGTKVGFGNCACLKK
jgi:hypothetical protein